MAFHLTGQMIYGAVKLGQMLWDRCTACAPCSPSRGEQTLLLRWHAVPVPAAPEFMAANPEAIPVTELLDYLESPQGRMKGLAGFAPQIQADFIRRKSAQPGCIFFVHVVGIA